MEQKLLANLLNAECPVERAETDRLLAANPEARRMQGILRRALSPLSADRDDFDPPVDLWKSTLAVVAEHVVGTDGPLTEQVIVKEPCLIKKACSIIQPASCSETVPEPRKGRNLFAAVGLSAAALAFIVPGLIHVRTMQGKTACADVMRQFHASLSGYSELNDGKFPMVEEGQPVKSVVMAMRETGQLPANLQLSCPVGCTADNSTLLANYAYNLGYRENGGLHGLTRTEGDLFPILADAPKRTTCQTQPINHCRGQNVLFSGGNVTFCSKTTVGMYDDDIFFNADRKVGAGLFRWDSVLGRAEDKP
jgi:hypothetical protein